jgi:hypothetical protein
MSRAKFLQSGPVHPVLLVSINASATRNADNFSQIRWWIGRRAGKGKMLMKQTMAELSCLGLLLMGTAGVVTSLFVSVPERQLEIISSFAIVMLAACVAKSFLRSGQPASNG